MYAFKCCNIYSPESAGWVWVSASLRKWMRESVCELVSKSAHHNTRHRYIYITWFDLVRAQNARAKTHIEMHLGIVTNGRIRNHGRAKCCAERMLSHFFIIEVCLNWRLFVIRTYSSPHTAQSALTEMKVTLIFAGAVSQAIYIRACPLHCGNISCVCVH